MSEIKILNKDMLVSLTEEDVNIIMMAMDAASAQCASFEFMTKRVLNMPPDKGMNNVAAVQAFAGKMAMIMEKLQAKATESFGGKTPIIAPENAVGKS